MQRVFGRVRRLRSPLTPWACSRAAGEGKQAMGPLRGLDVVNRMAGARLVLSVMVVLAGSSCVSRQSAPPAVRGRGGEPPAALVPAEDASMQESPKPAALLYADDDAGAPTESEPEAPPIIASPYAVPADIVVFDPRAKRSPRVRDLGLGRWALSSAGRKKL